MQFGWGWRYPYGDEQFWGGYRAANVITGEFMVLLCENV